MDYRYQYHGPGNITARETEEGPFQYGYNAAERLIQIEDSGNPIASSQYIYLPGDTPVAAGGRVENGVPTCCA